MKISGKSTGLVTTTRVTHATPAAMYAHSANRYWESDDKLAKDVPPDLKTETECKDIARQLVEDSPGQNFNVRAYFLVLIFEMSVCVLLF